MIDFACKQFNLLDVVKCSLNLTKADFTVFEYLLKHDGSYASEQLARTVKLDVSTVQRALKKLHSKGIVHRVQKNFEGGGYHFEYRCAPRPAVRVIILKTIHEWTTRVDTELNKW